MYTRLSRTAWRKKKWIAGIVIEGLSCMQEPASAHFAQWMCISSSATIRLLRLNRRRPVVIHRKGKWSGSRPATVANANWKLKLVYAFGIYVNIAYPTYRNPSQRFSNRFVRTKLDQRLLCLKVIGMCWNSTFWPIQFKCESSHAARAALFRFFFGTKCPRACDSFEVRTYYGIIHRRMNCCAATSHCAGRWHRSCVQ